jgi:hypothetical protein
LWTERAALSHERDSLNAQLRAREEEVATLSGKVKEQLHISASLEAEVSSAKQQEQQAVQARDQAGADRDALSQRLKQSRDVLAVLQKQLDSRDQDRAGIALRIADLETKTAQTAARLKERDEQIAARDKTIEQQQELLASDRDIRELMGARDLYIAEVYDVGRDGKKQRAYGRMFYTKSKSLIFYAYDLDEHPGVTSASTFQAWGQRGADRSNALNLGILYIDSAAKKRWALRFDDPKVLDQIDAVFITVEPNKESRAPSGKPLLMAYLHIQPNHP